MHKYSEYNKVRETTFRKIETYNEEKDQWEEMELKVVSKVVWEKIVGSGD